MCPLSIQLNFNDDYVCLKSGVSDGTGFKYQIKQCRLLIQRVATLESFQMAFEAKLLKQPAQFVCDVFTCKSFIIPQNQRIFEVSDAFSVSFSPQKTIACLIDQNVSLGQLGTSVFNFKFFNLKNIFLTINSFRDPNVSFRLDVSDDNTYILRSWLDLFGNNSTWSTEGLIVDRIKYTKNYPFIPFSMLNLETECPEMIHPKKLASVRIHLEFSADNPCLKLILFNKAVQTITVDSQRACFKDFSF